MKLPFGVCLLFAAGASCALGDPAVIAGAPPPDAGAAEFDDSAISANMGSGDSASSEGAAAEGGNGGVRSADSSGTEAGGGVEGGGGDRADGGSIDPNLPPEPTIPVACATLSAAKTSANGLLSDENNADTTRIQAVINGCVAGQSVKLQSSGANNAFLAGPLIMAQGVTLWVDAGTTLFASRNPRDFDVSAGTCGTYANDSSTGCKPLIAVSVSNAAVMGDGVIDGRGGEPMVGAGSATWWDVAQGAKSAGSKHSNPTLIDVNAAQNFTLYRITLHNSPGFHVVVGAKGFMIWGVSVLAPSMSTNSMGKALTANYARNTDGIDPNGATDGYVVYSKISTGDDQISMKAGSRGAVKNLVIAHNHFGTGHGMAIGSETNSGVSNVNVYDLSIDGSLADGGMSAADRNGIRITSGPSRGGHVSNVTYRDVCVRDLDNPIIADARNVIASGTFIPQFDGITISNFHSLRTTVSPTVTLRGYDTSHVLGIALDNVIVDGISAASVKASFGSVTEGPGNVNFTPSGSNVTVNSGMTVGSPPNSCVGKWVSF